ncbi:integrase, catalytic region, zinc finger, CCHC-type containing protein, partial [Tanacetum coccineum]
MPNMSEDIQCAGSDTLPPMLDRTDFESWQQRIRLYCLGKDNGENIMKSIDEGPFKMGTFRETILEGAEGALHLGPERVRAFTDLIQEEKERYKADIRATNILLQEGSELTKDERESQLYDDFEHFCQIKGETIHAYYVRFIKLINDMRNIKMTMPKMQLNSKFVNNMLPELSRFQHEVHANENKMMMERFVQPTNNPLALVSNASVQQYPTQSSDSPQSSHQPSLSDNLLLDSGYNVNNQGRPFQGNNARGVVTAGNAGGQNRVGNINPGQAKPIKCYNCNGIRHITRQCPQPKRPQDSNYFKDKMLLMQAQENDLALNVDHVFEADQCDAFDSDVDEAPTAQTMFMVNLSSEDPIYDEAGPSYDLNIPSEVQDHDNYSDSMDEYHDEHEM